MQNYNKVALLNTCITLHKSHTSSFIKICQKTKKKHANVHLGPYIVTLKVIQTKQRLKTT